MKIKILSVTKTFFALLLSSCLFFSCADPVKTHEQVQKKFPKSTIFPIPRSNSCYVVIDSTGNVFYVETFISESAEVSGSILIKNAVKH
jgi:hypothetical protein